MRRRLLLAAVAVVIAHGVDTVRAQRIDEYRVEAAVLYNLTKFVDWPNDAFADPKAPIVFCVLGADSFAIALTDTLQGHLVGQRQASVKRVTEVGSDCHVLFVASAEARRVPAIIDRLAGHSVLTVSEASAFIEQGGMIGMINEADRVRFDINIAAAEHANLKISAHVLALASVVLRKPEAKQ